MINTEFKLINPGSRFALLGVLVLLLGIFCVHMIVMLGYAYIYYEDLYRVILIIAAVSSFIISFALLWKSHQLTQDWKEQTEHMINRLINGDGDTTKMPDTDVFNSGD
ncbi:MAG TPA: hypothetical protein PKV16_08210 [Caldisericia bacterium]|nr:hypothetical protein [Caldisericia bacterium]HPF49759.1 hypothetical protein [Caldisericia bacterium]HPI84320.1 hypothetical protein [Caldisericia bacterium]HPQ93747.1 hypothetical protein [Caldisericia bacterium]HRV74829.1 hypothetical protein [Caldisericia bacterium]